MTISNTEDRVQLYLKAYDRFLFESDPIHYYDPLLSVISPPSRHKRMVGGYKLWPENEIDPASTVRIMSYGNSTGVWPKGNWSQLFADHLIEKGLSLTLFHGAGKGSTSSQEVVRVLRDAPQIKPHLIVSLSGVCDIGYLLNSPSNPFEHKYIKRTMDFLSASGAIREVIYGYPSRDTPAQTWCRNQRMARALADEMGIPIIVFLQPTQGFGDYSMNDEEAQLFNTKSRVILRGSGKSYAESVQEFYSEVLETITSNPEKYDHIIDFTNVFSDCPNAYRDHRHQNMTGVAHLAKKMLPIIIQRLLDSGIYVPERQFICPPNSSTFDPHTT